MFQETFLTFRTNSNLYYAKQGELITFMTLSFTFPAVSEVPIMLVNRGITALVILSKTWTQYRPTEVAEPV